MFNTLATFVYQNVCPYNITSYILIMNLTSSNLGPFRSISCRFRDNDFAHKYSKIGYFFKISTHDLVVYSPNYDVAHLLYIGHIVAKF